MKLLKTMLKALFGLLIFALLAAPLYLIWRISEKEMQAYAAPETPVLRQSAFGDAVQAKRRDVEIFTTVSGVGVSNTFADMELKVKKPELIRWSVGPGDVVLAGQTLGTLKAEPIISEYTGIIEQINAYNSENAYLRVRLIEPVLLECRADPAVLTALENANALTDGDGRALSLEYVSPICGPDGAVTVRLGADEGVFRYGETVEKLRVYTGKSYPGTLVLDRRCLYKKTADDSGAWYVRRVTEDGYFIEEVEVKVGYITDELACISGVAEGDWFDSGAQALQAGGQ